MDLATLPIPVARSMTRRRKAVASARKRLTSYQSGITRSDDGAQARRVMDLLWAKAFIDQALAIETRNTLGNVWATPGRIVGGQITNNGAVYGVVTRAANGKAVNQ